MKNHLAFFVLGCILLMLMQGLNAQIVNICVESDSVTLTLDNYQFGNIQWQQSTDNVNWENIEGALFHHYTCLPEKSTYYRAWISYQTCPPDSSQVSFLQRKVQANAGPDKVLNTGCPTLLFGNEYDGIYGQWTVLSGDSAYIEDLNAGNTIFYGTDSLYSLCWTLTDACGTSSDTITIEYVTNVYNDRIVIVDTTDLIVSDSADLSEGIYRIVFNDPVPTISYATILVGLQNGGFLRKVQTVIYIGDTCCMNTTQASPAELLVEGTIHIDDFASMIHTRGSNLPNTVVLDHCPTRAEILSDSLFHSNKMIYYPMGEHVSSDFQIEQTRSNGWHITYPPLTNPLNLSVGGAIKITDLQYDLNPHIDFEITSKWNEPLSLHFGSYNGTLDALLKLQILSPSIELTLFKKKLWQASKYYVYMAGYLPVLYSLKFDFFVEPSASISFSSPFGAELNLHTDYDARVTIDNWVPSKDFFFDGDLTGDLTFNPDVLGDGSVDINLYLAGEVYFSIYESLSAYFTIGPQAHWSICTNHEDGHFGGKNGVTVNGLGRIGLRDGDLLQYFGFDDDDYNFPFEFLKKDMRQPNRIGYLSGNNQLFTGSFSALPQPIRIKSYTYFNNPSTNNIVYFEPENGGMVNCAENRVTTNEEGIAEVIWSPATSDSKLRVSAYDCDNHHLEGSPIVITTAGEDCINSTLTAQAYLDEYFVDILVSGGVPPYLYSNDGLTYEEMFTRFVPEIGTEYTFYVKDAQNCVTTATYSHSSPYNEIICLDNNETISLTECKVVDIFGHYTDDDDFYARWLDFKGPNGYLTLYLGDLYNPSQLFNQGVYSGIYTSSGCDWTFVPLSANHFYLDISYLETINNGSADLVAGEIIYTRVNNIDIFNFIFTLANGQHYAGNFTGALGHEVFNNMKSDSGNRIINKQRKKRY